MRLAGYEITNPIFSELHPKPMKLFKNGEEYCAAELVHKFQRPLSPSRNESKETCLVLLLGKSLDTPNEHPKPKWEYDDGRSKRHVSVRSGTFGDSMMAIVAYR